MVKRYKNNPKIISTKAEGESCRAGQDCASSHSSSFVLPFTEAQVSRIFSSLNEQESSLDVPNKLNKNYCRAIIEAPSTHVYPLDNNWHRNLIFILRSFHVTIDKLNKAKGGKFLKKLWCCVGGSITR